MQHLESGFDFPGEAGMGHSPSPEKISEIARALYGQLPGAVSTSEPPAPAPPMTPPDHTPHRFDGPFSEVPLSQPFQPVEFESTAEVTRRLQSAATDVLSRDPANALARTGSGLSEETLSPNRMEGQEGLRNFIRGVRGLPVRNDRGLCTAHSDQHTLDRIRSAVSRSGVSSRPFDVHEIRRDFPILNQKVHGKPLVWLDNAATTQKPQSVIDALSRFYSRDNSNIHRGAHTLAARATDAYEEARGKVQRFLGAGTPGEILFVRGTTEGINLVANTYGRKFLKPGDEILLTVLEHHANIVPWQLVAKEIGAVIRVVPVTDRGEIILSEYQRLLGPRTRIAAFPHANNSLGTLLPVEEMTKLARRAGARVLIDGAQSVAHIPVNVRDLDCDFYVFSGHKIFGPTGIGAVYARSELLEVLPPWQGGGSMIKDVTFEQTVYSDPPAKFEAGTPNIADAVGLGAALDYVTRLGLPQIAKYEHELLEYATAKLVRIPGLRLIGTAEKKVSVLSFVLHNRPTAGVGRMLDQEGIAVRAGHHCAQPSLRRFGLEATVRPSLSLYNTREEVDHLAEAVQRLAERAR